MNDYPSDEDLKKIEMWDGNLRSAFAFIRSIWWAPEWGWREDTEPDDTVADEDAVVTCYRISTGGWSGNEDIIEAMRQNFMLWSLTWRASRRGGHYDFEIPTEYEATKLNPIEKPPSFEDEILAAYAEHLKTGDYARLGMDVQNVIVRRGGGSVQEQILVGIDSMDVDDG